MRLTLSTRNSRAVIANIRAKERSILNAVKAVVTRYGLKTQALVEDRCPKDTFFMSEHVRLTFSPGGFVYEVGWDESDFFGAGLDFYPLFQEFGTSKMAAQPSLFPVNAEIRPQFAQALDAALRGAVA